MSGHGYVRRLDNYLDRITFLEAQRRMGLKKTDKLAEDKIETSLQTD